MASKPNKRDIFFQKFLSLGERTGDPLPHPATLFAIITVSIVII